VNINAPVGTAAIYHFGTMNIIYVVVGCILVLFILAGLACCIRRKYKQKKTQETVEKFEL
jgi:hypothetical protein